jgi:penicillin-binding protein 2
LADSCSQDYNDLNIELCWKPVLIRQLSVLSLIILLLLVGCRPASQAQIEPLPTLAPPILPPPLEKATAVALNFLEDWRLNDYASMYALTTFSSQQATTLDSFSAAYQNAHDEMSLQGLSYTPITLFPDQTRSDVAIFNYNVSFDTHLLGTFEDDNRNMRLVFDTQANDWRVAWTPGDIFAELSGGGQLRLEISVPSRANIYDHSGNILADQNGRIVTVHAVKQEIPDWTACLNLLAPAMGKDPTVVQQIYDQSAPDWLMELGTLEAAVYDQLHPQLESVCAAQFDSRPTRHYDDGTLVPNIVGAVGYPGPAELPALEAEGFDSDSVVGISGIEKSWDDRLRGHPGGRLLIVGSNGDVVREVARSASRPPESVWLTIDGDLQTHVEKIVADYYANAKDSWGPGSKGAAVVIMNVQTGEILAMVSYPTYDADVFAPYPDIGRAAAAKVQADLQADPRRPLLNRPAQGAYPLGSVMKSLTAAAVADSGVYALDQRYTCTGVWKREDNFTRYDWLPGGHGTLTLSQAITQSCDPYFYEVGYQLDQYNPEALPRYMRQAGFGSLTGLNDLSESAGLIPDPEWKRTTTGLNWTFSDAVNIAIGQGDVQVTPLQVTRWFAAIANGGILYRPQLVEKVGILGEAPSYTLTPDAIANVNIRPEVLDVVREGLCNVTTQRSGTAEYQFRNSELQSIGVCGKTGTAQDGPATAEAHAWFAAYAPKDDPEIAIAVIVENAGEGSAVAAPMVRDILEYYFFGRK